MFRGSYLSLQICSISPKGLVFLFSWLSHGPESALHQPRPRRAPVKADFTRKILAVPASSGRLERRARTRTGAPRLPAGHSGVSHGKDGMLVPSFPVSPLVLQALARCPGKSGSSPSGQHTWPCPTGRSVSRGQALGVCIVHNIYSG